MQVCLDGDIDTVLVGMLNTDSNHGDHHGREDTNERGDRHPRDLLHGPGQAEDDGQDHTTHAVDNSADGMLGDMVHHGIPGEKVAAQDEDQE